MDYKKQSEGIPGLCADKIAEKFIEGKPQMAVVPAAHDEAKTAPLIHGMDSKDTAMTEGTVTYDIRFAALAPISGELIRLIINVEAQNDFYPGYPLVKRGIYYCSRMISSQYGTEFTESHYGDMKKGFEKGIEQGKIFGAISICRDLDLPEDIISEKLQKKFHLSKEEAKEYLQTAQ